MAFIHRLGNFGCRASSVAQGEKFIFRGAVAVVGICFEYLDNVTRFPGDGLFANANFRSKLRASQAFGEHAGNLEAGRSEAHQRFPLFHGPKSQAHWLLAGALPGHATRTAMPGRNPPTLPPFNCAVTL